MLELDRQVRTMLVNNPSVEVRAELPDPRVYGETRFVIYPQDESIAFDERGLFALHRSIALSETSGEQRTVGRFGILPGWGERTLYIHPQGRTETARVFHHPAVRFSTFSEPRQRAFVYIYPDRDYATEIAEYFRETFGGKPRNPEMDFFVEAMTEAQIYDYSLAGGPLLSLPRTPLFDRSTLY